MTFLLRIFDDVETSKFIIMPFMFVVEQLSLVTFFDISLGDGAKGLSLIVFLSAIRFLCLSHAHGDYCALARTVVSRALLFASRVVYTMFPDSALLARLKRRGLAVAAISSTLGCKGLPADPTWPLWIDKGFVLDPPGSGYTGCKGLPADPTWPLWIDKGFVLDPPGSGYTGCKGLSVYDPRPLQLSFKPLFLGFGIFPVFKNPWGSKGEDKDSASKDAASSPSATTTSVEEILADAGLLDDTKDEDGKASVTIYVDHVSASQAAIVKIDGYLDLDDLNVRKKIDRLQRRETDEFEGAFVVELPKAFNDKSWSEVFEWETTLFLLLIAGLGIYAGYRLYRRDFPPGNFGDDQHPTWTGSFFGDRHVKKETKREVGGHKGAPKRGARRRKRGTGTRR